MQPSGKLPEKQYSSGEKRPNLRMSVTQFSIAHERASDADGLRDVPPCLHPFTDRR